MIGAPSEGRTAWHPPRLIKVFAVRTKKHLVLSYLLSAQRKLLAVWIAAQGGMSFRWVHT